MHVEACRAHDAGTRRILAADDDDDDDDDGDDAPQVFETTIRILGGLTAAYYHSGGDEVYLSKAIEFAER